MGRAGMSAGLRRAGSATARFWAVGLVMVLVVIAGVMTASSMTIDQITIDGQFADWANALSDEHNVEFDASAPGDKDGPSGQNTLQSADRDVVRFATTWDDSNLFFYFKRSSSGTNNLHFLVYLDRDNDGSLSSTDYLLDFPIDNTGLKSPKLFYYMPSGGANTTDPITGDGVTEPGGAGATVPGFNAASMRGSIGSGYSDVEVELSITWAALGMSGTPGKAIQLHASTARGVPTPIGQVEDNVVGHTTAYTALDLAPSRDGASAEGTTCAYTHTLSQSGNVTDTVLLSPTSSNGWPTRVKNAQGSVITAITLRGTETTTVVLEVDVPYGTSTGAVDTAVLTATSARRSTVTDSVTDRTYVGSLIVYPDRSSRMATATVASYRHVISNQTAGDLTVDLSGYSWSKWPVSVWSADGSAETSVVTVPADGEVTVLLRVSTPTSATAGTSDVSELRAVARENPAYSDYARDVTVIGSRVDIRPDQSDSTVPFSVVTYRHTLTNGWGEAATLTVAAVSSNGWQTYVYAANGSALTTNFPVPSGESTEVVVRAVVPPTAVVGTADTMTVTASLSTSSTVRDTAIDRTSVVSIATFDDPGFRVPENVFRLGERVYTQAGGMGAYADGVKFLYRYPSSAVATKTPAMVIIKDQAEYAYSLGPTEPVGVWRVAALDPKSADATITGAVATYTVTYNARFVNLSATDAQTASDTVYVDSTLRNSGAATITASTVQYTAWFDANGDGVFSAGDRYIDTSGQPRSYGGTGTVSTYQSTVGTVSPGATYSEPGVGWALSNRDFADWGVYRVTAVWRTSGGIWIDESETTFFSPGTSPGLTLDKALAAGSPAWAGASSVVTFTVEVRNSGDTTLASVPLRDEYPAAELQYLSATLEPSFTGAGVLRWNDLGGLDPAETTTVTVRFRVIGQPSSRVATNSVVTTGALDAGGLEPRRASDLATVAVDAVAPVTTSDAPAGTVGATVTVTLEATDTLSGVAHTYYSLDSGTLTTYTVPFEVGEGAHTLTFFSVDAAGNVEAPAGTASFTVDLTPPGVSVVDVEDGGSYTATVTPHATSSDPSATVTATLDGSPYTLGDPITEPGEYVLVVTATDPFGRTSTETVTFTVLDDDAPAAPIDLVATGDTDSILLGWSASEDPDVTAYRLYRALSEDGTYTLIADGLTDATHDDVAIDVAVVYYYYVTAVDAAGNESARSNVASSAVFRTIARLAGQDRLRTAIAVSRSTFASAPAVILATNQSFADALSASGLAGSYHAPLLLTPRASLPAEVIAEISRLGATRVIIVGGTGAVSSGIQSALASRGLAVVRIGGTDRYQTAVLIAEHLAEKEGDAYSKQVFLARGDTFPDALAVSPMAYRLKAPILLTKPTGMPAVTRSYLDSASFETGLIAGGAGAISNSVHAEAASRGGVVWTRVGGATRYETAASIAAFGVEQGWVAWRTVGLATGVDFPDALTGGVAIGEMGGVLMVTTPTALHSAPAGSLTSHASSIANVRLFGGAGALSENVRVRVGQILE